MTARGTSTREQTSGTDTRQDASDHPGAAKRTTGRKPAEPKATQALGSKAHSALERLSSRDDGWLRISPDQNMNQVYIKWKFTAGRFPNKYVMVMCHWSEVAWGLELLEEKINSVWAGTLRPVEDRFYQ